MFASDHSTTVKSTARRGPRPIFLLYPRNDFSVQEQCQFVDQRQRSLTSCIRISGFSRLQVVGKPNGQAEESREFVYAAYAGLMGHLLQWVDARGCVHPSPDTRTAA